MADTAAHLVDRVFPHVPVRQWVLSLPFALRYRLAYDSEMVTAVLEVFIRALFGAYRRLARDYGGATCLPDTNSANPSASYFAYSSIFMENDTNTPKNGCADNFSEQPRQGKRFRRSQTNLYSRR